jgi:hypothetical protein
MRSRLAILTVLVLLGSVGLAACARGSVAGQVDGWSIGEGGPCPAGDPRCAQMIEVATRRLADRDPAHPLILQVTMHAEGLYPNDDGELGQVFRSGGFPSVVVFQLADGSRRAIGVKYVLRDDIPTAYDYGPERRQGRGGDGVPAPTI